MDIVAAGGVGNRRVGQATLGVEEVGIGHRRRAVAAHGQGV